MDTLLLKATLLNLFYLLLEKQSTIKKKEKNLLPLICSQGEQILSFYSRLLQILSSYRGSKFFPFIVDCFKLFPLIADCVSEWTVCSKENRKSQNLSLVTNGENIHQAYRFLLTNICDPYTVNSLYTDTRYNDKILYKGNLTGTKTSLMS